MNLSFMQRYGKILTCANISFVFEKNEDFLYFSCMFTKKCVPLPQILNEHDYTIYKTAVFACKMNFFERISHIYLHIWDFFCTFAARNFVCVHVNV